MTAASLFRELPAARSTGTRRSGVFRVGRNSGSSDATGLLLSSQRSYSSAASSTGIRLCQASKDFAAAVVTSVQESSAPSGPSHRSQSAATARASSGLVISHGCFAPAEPRHSMKDDMGRIPRMIPSSPTAAPRLNPVHIVPYTASASSGVVISLGCFEPAAPRHSMKDDMGTIPR